MIEIDYKIVCYGDFAIPVESKFMWLAWDADGHSFVYTRKPNLEGSLWNAYAESELFSIIPIPSPDPDLPLDKQLYYIG